MPADVFDRISYYNVPVTAERGAMFNPLRTLRAIAAVDDLVVIKVDIDAPQIEAALLAQIVADAELSSRIDELYFEHHVHRSPMAALGWRRMLAGSNETLPDSYALFSRLRALGIRAHSWV